MIDPIPTATYRIQLREGVGFAEVAAQLDYFVDLGISHLYLSPIFAAAAGSTHGYDVIDPTAIEPDLGGRAGFKALAVAAHEQGLGIILDIVPNHTAFTLDNPWLGDVLAGIAAAQAAGIAIKINMVAMAGVNEDEIEPMMQWAHGRQMGLTLIEGMPLGEVGIDRVDSYLPLRQLHDQLARRYTLTRLEKKTGGPARYVHVAETGGVLGFITPMSHNFCESCNRVRLTATGQLFLCLGQDDQVNLRDALRAGGMAALDAALDQAMEIKPKGHDFVLDRSRTTPAVARHMSVTGG